MEVDTNKPSKQNPSETQHEYRQRVMSYICSLISQKHVLTQICKDPDLPCYDTIYQWINDSDELSDMYARARTRRASARADKIDEITQSMIAGDIKPDVARVAIDAEKWQASKENARVYGDKMTLSGDPENPLMGMTDEQLMAKLESLRNSDDPK